MTSRIDNLCGLWFCDLLKLKILYICTLTYLRSILLPQNSAPLCREALKRLRTMVVDSTIRFNDRMDGPSVSLGSKLSNAKVSFAIFKRDIKRLLVNPVALVVTLGVCVIPSLYAWYNIVANWDPYGNTQGIKIAIANNDQGTQNDLVGELNAGDQVVDQLKENDQLGWTFVDSAADAKEGVESGEYYAAIVIPKNFSDNLVSMLDGNYRQPKLTYYVNEKKSAIAPKVTDTGANTIEEQINSEFVSTCLLYTSDAADE